MKSETNLNSVSRKGKVKRVEGLKLCRKFRGESSVEEDLRKGFEGSSTVVVVSTVEIGKEIHHDGRGDIVLTDHGGTTSDPVHRREGIL